MRNLLITVFVIGVLVAGYVAISKIRAPMAFLQGEKVRVHRGDLVVPINASGNIKPASITQVKSKASGEVKDPPPAEGTMVKKDQVVVQLTTIDELNNVQRANADWKRAKIELEKAKINREQLEKVDLPAALANVKKAKAILDQAQNEYQFQITLKAQSHGDVTKSTLVQVKSAQDQAEASVDAADAEVNRARIAMRMADQSIEIAKEAVDSAEKVLADAQQRLKECTIYAPIDGMVLTSAAKKGEVIQGAKTTFTGGSLLLDIADVSEIYAIVNVDEADIGQVRQLAPRSARPGGATQPAVVSPATLPAGAIEIGEPVEITVETFKDEKFHGQIERISPQSEIVAAIATFKVWIRITSDNRDKLVGLLNTQAEAHFSSKSVRNALLVSYDAFQKDPNGDDFGVYVPVPGTNREYKFKKCKFGGDNGIDVEVKEGLKEGDLVYTKLPQKTQKEQEAEDKGEKK